MRYDKQLFEAILDEDFYKTNEIISMICRDDDGIEYIEKILTFMENNPEIDYGMPGPVVHYVERFFRKGYEGLLYDSIVRKPTIHTLWMLNRIINSPDLTDKERYMQLLKNIAENPNESNDIKNEANEYLQYQISK